MIIQIRGTSGSGKTTAMREFIGDINLWTPTYSDGRKKPAYYYKDKVAVLGHYENVCGGCDTFKNYDQLQAAALGARTFGNIVVMEGLMLSDDVKQTLIMHERLGPAKILYLNTDLDTCVERVVGRRAERGQAPEFNTEKLRNRHEQIKRTRPRLEAHGVYCRLCSADQAAGIMRNWIQASR